MLNELTINPERVAKRIVVFLQTAFKREGFTNAVIGLSGGIDSAVSASLAVRALGRRNVFVGIYPYWEVSQENESHARRHAQSLGIPDEHIQEKNIKKYTDLIATNVNADEKLRIGNVAVRLRMIMLYDLAKKHNALVVGTENKTEHLLGYFTRHGDEASDVEPIRGLYKTQVRVLANYLKVHTDICKKTPSAGMWEGQTDESDFGFSYELADRILSLHTDRGLSEKEIVKRGFKKSLVFNVLDRMKKNAFKQNTPYVFDDPFN